MPIKKIVVIGPESTGKSTLCSELAAWYGTDWVPEFAREYLLTHGTNYHYDDLLTIAKEQLALEDAHAAALEKDVREEERGGEEGGRGVEAGEREGEMRGQKDGERDKGVRGEERGEVGKVSGKEIGWEEVEGKSNPGGGGAKGEIFWEGGNEVGLTDAKKLDGDEGRTEPLLFIDTDMYVMKVWCEFVFGKCPTWILEQINLRKYDGYLLCRTDLPWVKDELREYPDLASREKLFHIYRDSMINQSTPWAEIGGTAKQRLNMAVSAVDKIIGE